MPAEFDPLREQLELLLRQIRQAPDPWEEAIALLDRLITYPALEMAARLLEQLEVDLESPSLRIKADLTLRRLQISPRAADPVVQEAALREALALDPSHLMALAGLADLCARTGRLTEATRLCRTLLAHHRDALPPAIRAQAHTYLAQARLSEEGRDPSTLRRTRTDLEKALEAAPAFEPARRLLVEVCYLLGQESDGLALLHTGARFSEDPVGVLCEAARDLQQRVQRPDQAELLLEEACRLAPADERPLRPLIEIHRLAGKWPAVVRDVAALASLTSPTEGRKERAAAYFTMGQLYQEKLADPLTALACFLQALDLDPLLFEAFQRATQLLEKQQDWRGLEEHHRRMLSRLSPEERPEVRGALWKNLGQLYRQYLGLPAEARLALETAHRLLPGDEEVLEALGSLYAATSEVLVAARRRIHRLLLVRQPERTESLRELFMAAAEEGDLDEAWWLAARLKADGQATPQEEAYYHNLQRTEPPCLPEPLPEQLWCTVVRHPNLMPELEYLLAGVAPYLIPWLIPELRSLELKARDLVPPDAPLLVNRIVRRVTATLGLPTAPPLYRTTGRTGGHLIVAQPAALLLGAEQLAGRSPAELSVELVRELIFLRGGHLFLAAFDPPRLHWLLTNILAWFGFGSPPDDSPQTRQLRAALERGPEQTTMTQLTALARQLHEQPGRWADLARQKRALLNSAARLALLISEDLPTCLTGFAGIIEPEELRYFAISPIFLKLRQELGLAFEPEMEPLNENSDALR